MVADHKGSRHQGRVNYLSHSEGPLLAHSDASRQRSTSVAFGAKRTLTEPRYRVKADKRVVPLR
jgi:hypothetical protein